MLRWLQLGAASIGLGLALVGWSLVGPEIGVAGADSGAGSSSSGPASSSSKRVASATTATSGRRGVVAPRADVAPRTVNRAERNAVTAPMVTAASKGDPLGALGKFLTGGLKELLNRKTLLNPLQRLDDLTPKQKSLLDLIPKIPVRKEDSLWYREVQAREAERTQQASANKQRMAEIILKGARLTASDGTAVYSMDGKVFVRYTITSFTIGPKGRVDGPLEPQLFTLSDRSSQRNKDAMIRSILKLDPAQVRSTWGK
ncbi:hypothetical protein ACRDU6_07700 [Mycolicibacterium sp. ELW1]|uniref:hypothetical protein n=1 Tax=Mycobacteriaceae TaxID=1762 RepID=UPI0011EBE18C|nr:hypothetical protein [Mycobacterium sp. ELW1]QEN12575.1 hypothetical protein D3H54_04255 [Mycobacterium sp. ELW1]